MNIKEYKAIQNKNLLIDVVYTVTSVVFVVVIVMAAILA
jgi:hypothetical protein